ncbi:SGNH/GDSL hydrolase family protein [Rhodopseudomonas telluris]|uniref:GDSL-type esterase/lipase family protein n=1 Tax=Rhodopseudomonas telluris TaxID=644215 RepID=A0ABV6ES48_9BRAD
MSDKPKSLLGALTARGPKWAIAGLLLLGIAGPASAQFFGFGGPSQPPPRPPRGVGGYNNGGGGGFFGSDVFAPFQHQAPPRRAPAREDYSRAPSPEKRETQAERNVVVLGDAMADWLAYGLEQAYTEQPEMGVIRKHKTVSGLLRYQPKGEPSDWIGAAKEILAGENPDAIVVMLGLNDRAPITEPVADKDKKKDADAKPDAAKPDAAKPDDKPAENAAADDDDEDDGAPQIMAPEKSKRGSGVAQFRDTRWAELYSKKLDEMIAVLKAKGVPVLWVGLPAVRGTKSTSDAQFLNALYRDAAAKAGITYVDVWDGFVDEGGRYMLQGPDFEGQTRRLRSYDGVYFTKAGARKLAHYVEREIARLLAARSGPIALPTEPATPDTTPAKPEGPPPRPIAGPIVPLVASAVSTDKLLGGPGASTVPVDALVTRTLVKGEPLAAPAGRADDYAWPRREIVVEKAQEPPPPKEPPKSAVPMASNTPGSATASREGGPQQQQTQQRRVVRAAPPPPPPAASGFFGFAPAQQQPQVRRAPPPTASGFFSIFR